MSLQFQEYWWGIWELKQKQWACKYFPDYFYLCEDWWDNAIKKKPQQLNQV